MIRSKRGLLAIGTTVFLLGLIVLFPARVAVHWFAPAELAVSGIDGSAWSGSAAEASFDGGYFRNTRWRIEPLRLLTGKLSYRVETTPTLGFIQSRVDVGLGNTIALSDLSASLPLSLLADAAGVPGLQGNASLTFERVDIVDGLATAADGTVAVDGLVVPLLGRDTLGGYKAEFFTQTDGIAASVEDTDGVVDVAGSLQLKHDRSYEFIAQFVAKPNTPQNVRQQLNYLPLNDRGQRELREEGTL